MRTGRGDKLQNVRRPSGEGRRGDAGVGIGVILPSCLQRTQLRVVVVKIKVSVTQRILYRQKSSKPETVWLVHAQAAHLRILLPAIPPAS